MVHEELKAASESRKVGVAQVGKALGAKWGALSEEEKQVYKTQAAQLAGKWVRWGA